MIVLCYDGKGAMGKNKGADPKKKGGGLYNDEYMYDDGSLVCHNTDEVEVYLGEAEAPLSCDDNYDEYTNLCNLCFVLFLFIYSSLPISFSFLHYLTIPHLYRCQERGLFLCICPQ